MVKKPVLLLLALLAVLAAAGGACWLLLAAPREDAPQTETILLSDRSPEQVSEIRVDNANGSYTFTRTGEGYRLHDLPARKVNEDYVNMLLDESSRVECLSQVTDDLSSLDSYGLARPEAQVEIQYTDGGSLALLFGAQEPISGGRYCMERGGGQVYLMKNNRTIRFTMAVERYLDFIIIPPEETEAVLSVLQDMTFSGTSLPAPISLRAVLPERPETQIEAVAFGSVTHLVEGPVVHEVNTTALLQIAEDLLGLISEGVVDYNCTQEELDAYGFGQPWLQIDFDYKNGANAPVEPYSLRVARWEGGYIATLNGDGIVYKILDLSFLHVTYEELVLRWFFSPFLTELEALELTSPEGAVRFDLDGSHARDLTVSRDGEPVDGEGFRKFYNLIVSAAADAPVSGIEPEGEPALTVRYLYRNPEKEPDELALYPAPQRRLYASVNGVCEFTMREGFLDVVRTALDALLSGEDFSTDW